MQNEYRPCPVDASIIDTVKASVVDTGTDVKASVVDTKASIIDTVKASVVDTKASVVDTVKAYAEYDVIMEVLLQNNVPFQSLLKVQAMQKEPVAYVACLILVSPETTLDPSTTQTKTIELFSPDRFPALKTLLDGARRIFCTSEAFTYGHLRATANEIVTLSPSFSSGDLSSHGQKMPENPLLEPLPNGHRYAPYFNTVPEHSKLIAALKEEGKRVTTIAISEPDEEWIRFCEPFVDAKIEAKAEHDSQRAEETTHQDRVYRAEPNQYNRDDTEGIRTSYFNVPRLIVGDKKEGVYFREHEMMHWRMRTSALVDDLKVDELELADLYPLNCDTLSKTWRTLTKSTDWSETETKTKSEEETKVHMEPLMEPFSCKQVYDAMTKQTQNKTEFIQRLTNRLSFLADVCFDTYIQHKPIRVVKGKWDRKTKQYQTDVYNIKVTVSEPGIVRTSSVVDVESSME